MINLCTSYANRQEKICIEIYKIKNGLNPKYMNDLITERPSQHQYRKPLDLLIPKSNQISFGYKSFRTLAPTIWNTLPAEIQALTKLDEFKTKIGKINLAWCSCQRWRTLLEKTPTSTKRLIVTLFLYKFVDFALVFNFLML